MIALLFKDFSISKNSYSIYGFLIFLVIGLYSFNGVINTFQTDDLQISNVGIAILIYVLIYFIVQFNSFYNDYKNNSIKFVCSLPIKRINIVVFRYLFIFIIITFPIFLYCINSLFLNLLGVNISAYMFQIKLLPLLFASAIILMYIAIQTPLFYLLNFKDAKKITGLVSSILMLVPLIYGFIYWNSDFENYFMILIEKPLFIDEKLLIYLIITSIILFFSSMIISAKILKRKDV
ncbi:UNVERIFIED_CONTAM: ABC-2 family transporter [Acetivibrio alkalicellulosi]